MNKDLMMEVYASDMVIKRMEFLCYRLEANTIFENGIATIRNVCRKISSVNNYMGVYENGYKIYTLEKIENMPEFDNLSVVFDSEVMLDIAGNERIYSKAIEYFINQKLRNAKINEKYAKYSCKNGKEIICNYIKDSLGRHSIIENSDRSIRLSRKFKIDINVKNSGQVYMELFASSEFTSKHSVADLLEKGNDIEAVRVKNDWSSEKQSGVIECLSERTVSDKLSWGCSLKEYYIKLNQGYRVDKISDDTQVVDVKMHDGKIVSYYPHALKPVITREYILKYEPEFSKRIEKLVKLNTSARIELDLELISDIGEIKEIGGMKFNSFCCPLSDIGYKKGSLSKPTFICGNNKEMKCGQEMKVFSNGFYSVPDRKVKIGYLYPEEQYDLLKSVCNEIYSFCVLGKYQGEDNQYIKEKILPLDMNPQNSICETYKLSSITDYKRAANKFKNSDIDLIIAIIPGEEGMDENPYNPFKTIWAEWNVPSQMITKKTAEMFARGTNAGQMSLFYLHNIVLGILGKIGGVPWIIKDMPGNVDCFVGLDVATVDKGIHYPACAVLFDKYGRIINFYKPKLAQRGEKIETDILQEIFDDVIISYEDRYGEKLKNIVIHRDGFSNENLTWYQSYFKSQKIDFSILEVRKNIDSKVIYKENEEYKNAPGGYCVYNNEKAYLVTTDIKENLGSPNPILVEKSYGSIKMPEALTQIMYLSQLHVGSTKKMRLPVTTGYADKICKNIDYVPQGRLEGKLFFL